MGKTTGFMDYARADCPAAPPAERVGTFCEFHRALPEKKRREQGARCMDCGVPVCQAGIVFEGRLLGCPLHNLIPEWNDMLWLGNRDHALARLLKTNPFPEFTGRVCPAPCERACTCAVNGEAVTIRENELSIIEEAFAGGRIVPHPPENRSGKRVAIVGSGPAGLAAAQRLNMRGHSVVVFERDQKPGGLLTYGIPNMKLDKTVVARRVALLTDEGVVFRCGVDVGRDIEAASLARDFDAVILACGARAPRSLACANACPTGILYALDYLFAVSRQALGEIADAPNAAGRHVVVIGAGDSASDCVATALRQGAANVAQVIRRPAAYYGDATDYAHEEAEAVFGGDIRRFESTVKTVVSGEDGAISAVEVVCPAGAEVIPCDMLVIASGFCGPDASARAVADALKDAPNVFVAGDMKTGASLVVIAVADGIRAAAEAERAMLGYTGLR